MLAGQGHTWERSRAQRTATALDRQQQQPRWAQCLCPGAATGRLADLSGRPDGSSCLAAPPRSLPSLRVAACGTLTTESAGGGWGDGGAQHEPEGIRPNSALPARIHRTRCPPSPNSASPEQQSCGSASSRPSASRPHRRRCQSAGRYALRPPGTDCQNAMVSVQNLVRHRCRCLDASTVAGACSGSLQKSSASWGCGFRGVVARSDRHNERDQRMGDGDPSWGEDHTRARLPVPPTPSPQPCLGARFQQGSASVPSHPLRSSLCCSLRRRRNPRPSSSSSSSFSFPIRSSTIRHRSQEASEEHTWISFHAALESFSSPAPVSQIRARTWIFPLRREAQHTRRHLFPPSSHP